MELMSSLTSWLTGSLSQKVRELLSRHCSRCWLPKRTWATPNRKLSTSGSYGCLSRAIHQAPKTRQRSQDPALRNKAVAAWSLAAATARPSGGPSGVRSGLDGTRLGVVSATHWLAPLILFSQSSRSLAHACVPSGDTEKVAY